MPGNDLSLLIDAARRAGDLARDWQQRDLGVQRKDHDNSPVTKADLAVNDLLAEHLRGARPDYGWLSEESADDPTRLEAERVFIVDPIDGTRSYIDGSDVWAHSIAVAHRGVIESAVVFLPVKDRLYAAGAGAGATLNDAPLAVSDTQDVENAELLATRPSLEEQHWPGGVPVIRRSHRPSLAYRLSLVAQGRYDAMVTFRPAWEWDIAAGALILAESGARVSDRRGGDLRFNNPHPQTDGVLAANPALHAALLQRML